MNAIIQWVSSLQNSIPVQAMLTKRSLKFDYDCINRVLLIYACIPAVCKQMIKYIKHKCSCIQDWEKINWNEGHSGLQWCLKTFPLIDRNEMIHQW